MKNRLRLLVAATSALMLAAFVVPLGLMLRTQAEDRAVVSASLQTQAVSALVLSDDPERLRRTLAEMNTRPTRRVTVFLPGGEIAGARARADNAVELARRRGLSFATEKGDGREFLIAVRGLPGGTAVVRTYISEGELHDGVIKAWLVLVLVSLLLLAIAVALGDVLGRSVIRPVQNLMAIADRLASGDLAARAPSEGPDEIRRIGTKLNSLADRVRVLLATERKETADFARQLRTAASASGAGTVADAQTSGQFSAFEGDAQTSGQFPAFDGDPQTPGQFSAFDGDAQTSGQFPAFGNDAFENDVEVPDETFEAAHAQSGPPIGATCDLAAVTVDRARYWSTVAEGDGRDLRMTSAPLPVTVHVSRDDLEVVIDALIGNVFTHTPEGTPLWILAEPVEGGGRLIVEDAGPGFPDMDLARARDSRGSWNGPTGQGLQLSRGIAEAAGGEITLTARRGGGAQVIVDFG